MNLILSRTRFCLIIVTVLVLLLCFIFKRFLLSFDLGKENKTKKNPPAFLCSGLVKQSRGDIQYVKQKETSIEAPYRLCFPLCPDLSLFFLLIFESFQLGLTVWGALTSSCLFLLFLYFAQQHLNICWNWHHQLQCYRDVLWYNTDEQYTLNKTPGRDADLRRLLLLLLLLCSACWCQYLGGEVSLYLSQLLVLGSRLPLLIGFRSALGPRVPIRERLWTF